jgi:hypothetical protein
MERMMPKNLLQAMDKVSYEIFAKRQPDVIAAIDTALDQGVTATQIERVLIKRFGLASLTGTMAACAAHYLENKRKEN